MTRHWSSKDACDKYYSTEGFIIGKAVCQACGFEQNVAVEPGMEGKVAEYLQCGRCGKMKAKFIPKEDKA